MIGTRAPHALSSAFGASSIFVKCIFLAGTAGCTFPKAVFSDLQDANEMIERADKEYAQYCAPIDLAEAQSNARFGAIELEQGNPRRASEHVELALEFGRSALDSAVSCSGYDRDGDKIPDVVDQCPDEAEDMDGDQDEDGCPDMDPYGDEDGDGIINIDDDCVSEAEDFDGHNDADGCPETSDDSDGDAIIDAFDQCPEQAEDLDGYRDTDGCPDIDNDNDNVNDDRDQCPNEPEDIDDFDDEDGCPDVDNDDDGVLDADDACPTQSGPPDNDGCPSNDADEDGISDDNDRCPGTAETVNGYLDDDGCPDSPPSRVTVTRTRVEIQDTIEFASGSDTLLASANSLLDEVVKVLDDAPHISLRIEGHTDSDGSDDFNLQLSKDRAASVRQYLVDHGVNATRLTSEGYGETKPIDTNRTSSGRAKNRRVEFHITSN